MYVLVGKAIGEDIAHRAVLDPKFIVDALGSKIDKRTCFDRELVDDEAMLFNFKYHKDNYLVIVTGWDVELYKQIQNVSNDGFVQWKDISDKTTNDIERYKDRTLSGLARVGKFKFNLKYNVCKDYCKINMVFDNGNRTKEIMNAAITSGVTNDLIKEMIIDMIKDYTYDVVDSAIEVLDI